MEPVLLFRQDLKSEQELAIAQQTWTVITDRTESRNQLIIGRYSVLPYYEALEEDLSSRGSQLINTFAEHRWIAQFEYYETIKDLTPETWTDETFSEAPEGAFVLKGATNSFKHQWRELMFAESKADARKKAQLLREKQTVAQQGLLYRRYVPLENFGATSSGLPITNEWRFFYYRQELIAAGYYWASFLAEDVRPSFDHAAADVAQRCAEIVGSSATFFVIDVAKTIDGDWIVIELNDGQSSGLVGIDPGLFYPRLRELIAE